MVLVPVSESNVDAYAAFVMAEADAEGRAYMATIDLRARLLQRGLDHFCLRDGKPLAVLTISRTQRPDGSQIIALSITPADHRTDALLAGLEDVLADEPDLASVLRLYRLSVAPDQPVPEDELAAAGFAQKPGSHKYRRDPGPPRPGEFPGADKALAEGYATHLATPAMIADDPSLFARLADIYNRTLAVQPGIQPRSESAMRESLTAPGHGFIVAVKDGEITGYLAFTPMGKEVLVGEYASLRRHWGTGSVDALCRHVAAHVAEQWNLPIIGYATATNAPSCRAMERSGMRRVDTQPLWECRVEAGVEAPFRSRP